MKKALVTGAGGFIGHHLVKHLVKKGYYVRGVDIKYPEYEETSAHEFHLMDLREKENCLKSSYAVDEVYQLAANMGGIGFIENEKAVIVYDNILVNAHMLEAARINNVGRYLYTSSACVYPGYKQKDSDLIPLQEEDAYPADAEDGYGWEKLYTERMCRHYREDYGLETRIVRFHNIYGPLGAYDGGREKAPAALSRKIALTEDGGTIEVWGDGLQTRSFCYIDDCINGIYKIMQSNYPHPLNLGRDRMVTINEFIDIIAGIANKTIYKKHDLTKPQGVRGRNSDNSRLKEVIGWVPEVSLEEGMKHTYKWIEEQLNKIS